jgi:four helix bundle protein
MQKLDAYVVEREIAKKVHEAKIRDTELRDQATRAAKSCFLTLCEGLPNDGVAMRRKYFTESHNSLHEVVGAIDLAEAIGAVDSGLASQVQELAVRLKWMLRALLR